MTEFKDVLARASRPATVVSLCLDGQALGEIRELERQFDNAEAPTNLGERSQASVIAEQIQAIQARAAESQVDFHLRAIRGPDWQPFWQGRPVPAEGEVSEDFSARWFPFMCQMVSRTCVDPVMTPEEVAQLVDELPVDSWNELCEEVWALNTNKVSIPFSAAVSALTQDSGQTSRRPSKSASPSASSKAQPSGKRRRTTASKAKSPATP